jgi:Uma2 family endonuclease
MVLALPDDGNRYELFDGELLVTPAPALRHQLAVTVLYDHVAPYVTAHGLGRTLTSPADLHLGGEQSSQPDLFVLPRIPDDRARESAPNPVLIVEVLSPSTAQRDRFMKRRTFQRAGIPEYWIVDLDARAVERWRPGDDRPEILDDRLTWAPEGAGEPLRITLPELFTQVLGPHPPGAS